MVRGCTSGSTCLSLRQMGSNRYVTASKNEGGTFDDDDDDDDNDDDDDDDDGGAVTVDADVDAFSIVVAFAIVDVSRALVNCLPCVNPRPTCLNEVTRE